MPRFVLKLLAPCRTLPKRCTRTKKIVAQGICGHADAAVADSQSRRGATGVEPNSHLRDVTAAVAFLPINDGQFADRVGGILHKLANTDGGKVPVERRH